jgi:hypothetical protein
MRHDLAVDEAANGLGRAGSGTGGILGSIAAMGSPAVFVTPVGSKR